MRSTRACGLILTILSLTSCAAIRGTECSWESIITVSRDDKLTRLTAEQIIAHNEKVEKFCH
jgi:hypothetical protein